MNNLKKENIPIVEKQPADISDKYLEYAMKPYGDLFFADYVKNLVKDSKDSSQKFIRNTMGKFRRIILKSC